MLDPIQYEFRFFQNTLADPEPGAGVETSIFRLRLQPKVSAPCGSGSTTLVSTVNLLQFLHCRSLRGVSKKYVPYYWSI
jgi:hypothetical protein